MKRDSLVRRSTPLVLICVALVLGFAATAMVAQRSARNTERDNDLALERSSLQIAESVAAAIATDAALAEKLAKLTESRRMTMAEYRSSWSASFAGAFEGDSTVSLYVAVAPVDLTAYVEAMQAFVPGFVATYLADDPSELGHVLTAMTATDSPYVGADMTVAPGMTELLASIGDGEASVVGFDRRFDDQPGQMLVIRGHRVLGADDVERRAWTAVFADLRPKVERIVEELGPGFRASITAEPIGKIGSYGLAEEAAVVADTARATATNGDFIVTVELGSDGSIGRPSAATRVWLIGSIVSLGVAFLAGLSLSLAALLERLGNSDRDARSDVLTGLNNRRWLTEVLAELSERPIGVALLFCDLDRFKVINDSAGHTVGDELLLQVARRLERAADGLGRVARWGGDEFVVLCETTDDPELVGVEAATQIVTALSEPFELSTGLVRISASVGVAITFAGETMTANELMREADVALGRCKERRVNGYVLYDESLKDDELDRLALEADLQSSLDNGDLLVYYQPIVDTHGTAVSYEALARWERNGQVLTPIEFLPLAAEIGRMEDLDRVVLDHALATLASAVAAGQTELTMHVNVDASDLNNADYPAILRDLLIDYGIEPSKLILELTEGEWFDSIDSITPVLRSLNEMGVGLAIDDFGSGYSSLGRLLEVPGLTELKIDRLMVDNVGDRDFRIFLTSLIGGLQELGLEVISEGIETEEQLGLLQEMGVTCFQGYLFGEPVPSAEAGLGSLKVDAAPTNTFW